MVCVLQIYVLLHASTTQYCAFRRALAFCRPLLSLVACLSYTSSARLVARPCLAFNFRLRNAAFPLSPNCPPLSLSYVSMTAEWKAAAAGSLCGSGVRPVVSAAISCAWCWRSCWCWRFWSCWMLSSSAVRLSRPSCHDRWSSLPSTSGSASRREVNERVEEVDGLTGEDVEEVDEDKEEEEEDGAVADVDAGVAEVVEAPGAAVNVVDLSAAECVDVSVLVVELVLLALSDALDVLGSEASRSARRSSKADVVDSTVRILVPSVVSRDMAECAAAEKAVERVKGGCKQTRPANTWFSGQIDEDTGRTLKTMAVRSCDEADASRDAAIESGLCIEARWKKESPSAHCQDTGKAATRKLAS